MLEVVRADLAEYGRFYGFQPSLGSFVRSVLTIDSFTVLLLIRLRAWVAQRRIPVLSRILRLWLLAVYGVDVDVTARLGAGVIFLHTVGVIIGGDSELGAGCMLMGSNTIGTNNNSGYPKLGKGVRIGAGARLIGPIAVGDAVTVGANAVVTKDVPAGATVVAFNKIVGNVARESD